MFRLWFFFFFKQKTAYEMRISDWSSDVCSSDLGQFESLQAASKRLSIVVPLCFAGIFLLLYMALGTFGRATAVFLAVPLGLAGGVFTLALTGINFSVSAAVGFICLAGVAVLNGLVVMTAIREWLENGVPLVEAIREGM